jgi:hypothetical protein
MRNQIHGLTISLEKCKNEISVLESEKKDLSAKLAKFNRRRVNGRFVKSTI